MPAQRAARARRFCSFFLRAARLRAVLRRLGVRSWTRIVASYEGCLVNGRGVSGVHLRCGLSRGVRHGLLGSREAIDPPRRPSGLRTDHPDPWSRHSILVQSHSLIARSSTELALSQAGFLDASAGGRRACSDRPFHGAPPRNGLGRRSLLPWPPSSRRQSASLGGCPPQARTSIASRSTRRSRDDGGYL
jgi:hypothetical protein